MSSDAAQTAVPALDSATLERVCHVLRVLTHPDRLRLCERLLERRQSVGDLATALELRQSVVSQHLTHLHAHGIVARERDGRSVYYTVIHPGPGWLLACIRQHADAGLTP